MVAHELSESPCLATILYRTLAMSWASGITLTVFESSQSSWPAHRATQPLTTTGPCPRLRRTARRLLAVARKVTAQPCTTDKSAGSPAFTSRKPRPQRNSDICWASYWLTLQPMAFIWYVFKVATVPQCRPQLSCGQSVSAALASSSLREFTNAR